MLLEPLISVIETMKERVQQHGQSLRQSEALTRYALIDPIFGLGHRGSGDGGAGIPGRRRFADYALMGPSGPVSLLEAKKLGENLSSGVGQALNRTAVRVSAARPRRGSRGIL